MRKILITLGVIALALLAAGCSTVSDAQWQAWADVEKARHAASVDRARACGEDKTCVAWVNVETARGATPMPQVQRSGLEAVGVELVRAVVPALSAYHGGRMWAGALEGTVGALAGMDRSYTNNSVNVGRDQIGGDRSIDNSNNSDNSTGIGGDNAGRDIYRDSCVGPDCRYGSDGPIDESDNRQTDNSDNSAQPPPAAETAPE